MTKSREISVKAPQKIAGVTSSRFPLGHLPIFYEDIGYIVNYRSLTKCYTRGYPCLSHWIIIH
jgi:hypothetical protein